MPGLEPNVGLAAIGGPAGLELQAEARVATQIQFEAGLEVARKSLSSPARDGGGNETIVQQQAGLEVVKGPSGLHYVGRNNKCSLAIIDQNYVSPPRSTCCF